MLALHEAMTLRSLATMTVREQALCGALVMLLSGYLFYTAVVEPQLLELRSTQAKLEAQHRILLEKRRIIARRAAEEQNRERIYKVNTLKLAQLRREVKALDDGFFRPGAPSLFLSSLDAIASSQGCRLVSMEFLPQESVGKAKDEKKGTPPPSPSSQAQKTPAPQAALFRPMLKIPARVILRGRYIDILQLLQALEDRPQEIPVAELRIDPVPDGSEELNATFILTLLAFES